jgi:putative transposase
MGVMNGEELRGLMSTVFDREELSALAREYGMVRRERSLDVMGLITALVLAGGTEDGGRQYDALRTYLMNTAKRVARSAFYSWFNEPLERLLRFLLERAMRTAAASEKILPGILGSVVDWIIVDSTTIALDKELIKDWPGAGDYAALKIHKEWSVGTGNLRAFKLTAARDHDSPHLVIDEAWRGLGLLADLGYASIDRLVACDKHGVRYVIRLKDSWKPKVDRIVRGSVGTDITPSDDLDLLLAEDIIIRDGRAVDAEVTVGRGAVQVRARLVGVPTPKGYCFFLTNLPRNTHGPLQVGDLYRVRWEIEIDNKVDKTGARIDEIAARRPVSVRILVLASLVNTVLARILVQSEKRAILSDKKRAARAPLHPIQTVRVMVFCHALLMRMLDGEDIPATEWSRLTGRMRVLAHDPNWRRRPSVLDKIMGLVGAPHPRRTKGSKILGKLPN